MVNRRGRKDLSLFTYFLVFLCVGVVTILVAREIRNSQDFEEILYQREIENSIQEENRYYINKIKDEYGINVIYGQEESSFTSTVDANVEYDENIINNNVKKLYAALKKYPHEMFSIFEDKKYSLYIILVSSFNDNNIALASKNNLNQYRIYLSNNENFERAFHHEFFHVMEYYMEANAKYVYYSWNSYNPYGFKYNDDTSSLTDEFVYNKYMTDEELKSAYFLTKYSKVSQKEDRAEIFAELMMLTKGEKFLKNGTRLRSKVDYLVAEISENITIYDFYFSSFLRQ